MSHFSSQTTFGCHLGSGKSGWTKAFKNDTVLGRSMVGFSGDLDAHRLAACAILVVDDEADIRGSVSRLLAAAFKGITVDTAEHGQAGLKAIQDADKPYDLILSDYRMPGMDGIEFLHQCMTMTPDSYRVMMTAFPDRELGEMAQQKADVESFLTKPLEPSTVLMTVKELLEERLLETN